MKIEKLDEIVKSWLFDLGEFIHNCENYNVTEKDDFRDLVSDVDLALEAKIVKKISNLPGEHTILSEENFNTDVDLTAKNLWIVDPIDGTANFLKQKKDFGIIIAYFNHGEPILSYLYDVADKQILSAVKSKGIFINEVKQENSENFTIDEALISINPRKMHTTEIFQFCAENAFDLRFLGSSLADGLRVIKGQYGASLNPESEPWDRAPFLLFAEESGLLMCQFNGNPTTLNGVESYFFGTKQIYSEIFHQ